MLSAKPFMKKYVIIVAGGKGLRMGSELPKQFLPIGGKPVLMRTLEAFRKYEATLQIILVLPKEQQDFWKQLCEEYHFDVGHLIGRWGRDTLSFGKEWFGIGAGIRIGGSS